MKELSKEKLKGLLEMMFTYGMAFAKTMGASEGKSEEIRNAHRQIRKLIEDKPKVTKAFVEEWLEEKWCEDWCDPSYYKVLLSWLIDLLTEAGVAVEK